MLRVCVNNSFVRKDWGQIICNPQEVPSFSEERKNISSEVAKCGCGS